MVSPARDDAGADISGGRQDLAEQRTSWSRERTLLAKERTFAAWLRTGLAAFAVGFGVARLLGDVGPPWLARSIGVALILSGAAAVVIGFGNHHRALDELGNGGGGVPAWGFAALTITFVIIGIAGVALVLS